MLDVVTRDLGTWDDAEAARYADARGVLIALIAECTGRLAEAPESADLRRWREDAEDQLNRLSPRNGPNLDAVLRDAAARLAELRRKP